MRGTDERSGGFFSYVDLEARVRAPLRAIRSIVNDALRDLAPDFGALYSRIDRPSILPERLLRAMLLQAFYSVRSERQLMERLDTDLLFRWFAGLAIDDPVWDATVFSKNRDRLLEGAIAAKFLGAVLAQPRVTTLMSSEHFSVDGTLIEACASMKSFKPKDGSGDEPPSGSGRNVEVDFKGRKRSNETHASTRDPEARLYRKGARREAKLAFIGHALMENCSCLIVNACLTPADGQAERTAARFRTRGRRPLRWRVMSRCSTSGTGTACGRCWPTTSSSINRCTRFASAKGQQKGLKPVEIAGQTINPATDDFYQRRIIYRNAIKARLGDRERGRQTRTEERRASHQNSRQRDQLGIFVELNVGGYSRPSGWSVMAEGPTPPASNRKYPRGQARTFAHCSQRSLPGRRD